MWKKEILVILSGIILFASCQTNSAQQFKKNESVTEITVSKKELIQSFFNEIKSWEIEHTQRINKIGQQIAKKDSLVQFYGFKNAYENNAFLFSSREKEPFQDFEKNSFLAKASVTSTENYQIWRPEINGLQLWDISIEPHPTLHWVLVVRRRVQE